MQALVLVCCPGKHLSRLNISPLSAFQKKGDQPTGQQRRKHQITYLIHQVSGLPLVYELIQAELQGFGSWQHKAGVVEVLLQQLGTRGWP